MLQAYVGFLEAVSWPGKLDFLEVVKYGLER